MTRGHRNIGRPRGNLTSVNRGERPTDGPTTSTDRDASSNRWVGHARTFAALTLASRVLGLARDAIIVRILGAGGLGSAFAAAFQFPNTFRRLFGEGALSAAFIPEYAQLVERDPVAAARFSSLTLGLLGAGLGGATLLLGGMVALARWLVPLGPDAQNALLFLLMMLPYTPLVCVTALLGGMLQVHGRFAAQAGAPLILNVCMIAGGAGGAFVLELEPIRTGALISISVTIAGVAQTLWCAWDLRRLVKWTRVVKGAWSSTRRMLLRMGPVVLSLGAAQVATLIETWVIVYWPLAWGRDLPGGATYPLDDSAGAVLYSAQRLYQFPLGVFGIALATAAFPLLARQANQRDAYLATLRRGIRLSLFIGLPATAGIMWVAHDLCAVVYLGGRVSAQDVQQMSTVLIAYGALIATYSLIHVLTRAFYALGDTRLPTRISLWTIPLGLVFGAVLMWPLRETGLALGSSLAALVHATALALLAQARLSGTDRPLDRTTIRAIGRCAAGVLVMLATLAAGRWLLRHAMPGPTTWSGHALRLAIECGAGCAVYGVFAAIWCRAELNWLTQRSPQPVPGSGGG